MNFKNCIEKKILQKKQWKVMNKKILKSQMKFIQSLRQNKNPLVKYM